MRTPAVLLVVLFALVPGCSWLGGPGESSEPSPWEGPSIPIAVRVEGSRGVAVHLVISTVAGQRAAIDFDVPAGGEVERTLPVDTSAVNVVRASYAMDMEGRGATGSAEARYDPATCPKGFRILFVVRTGEELTSAGSEGTCAS